MNIQIKTYRNRSVSWLLTNPDTLQYFQYRYDWYCKKNQWEKTVDGQHVEVDELDGVDAVYCVSTKDGSMLFGFRVLLKQSQACLPVEGVENFDASELVVNHELSRFVSGKAIRNLLIRDIDTLIECMKALYHQSYVTCNCADFYAFLNVKTERFLAKMLGEAWITTQLSDPVCYRRDDEFAVFLLQRNATS